MAKSKGVRAVTAHQNRGQGIVNAADPDVKPPTASRPRGRPSRRSKRRQSHGSAWHWKQTDTWYYTLPGTKRRVPLLDEDGQRIRGLENRQAAQLALARVRLAGEASQPEEIPATGGEWLVARVCSEYLQYCTRGVERGELSQGHLEGATWVLNDLCQYCGALPVAQLKRGHIQAWMDAHPTWKSSATRRSVIAVVQAAFNSAAANHDLSNPLKGLKRPASQPKLHSLSREDEQALYKATDEPFRNFLFAAMHTGLRPFSELARLTAEHVEVTDRGMLWRVYATKTKKVRKIPVRPEVAELTQQLMAAAPHGARQPLFRNSRGTPWTKVAGVARFVAIRKTLGWDQDPVRRRYSTYSCRHTFAHRMLSGYWNGGVGCSIETLAELLGDTPKVAFDHYGREWGQHYQEPLWAAIGVTSPASPAESGADGADGASDEAE
ncbi:MAG: tyrosine-type recombinase/integrase [Planctomycetaceae bacterium]|nr:tyrosine-type recombinase/integrase [Planctomycetaceae bacterium]